VTGFYGQEYDEDGNPVWDPAAPLDLLRNAAKADKGRAELAVAAVRAMTAGGMDAGTEAVARDYVKREKLLPAASFDGIVREARGGSDSRQDPERKSASTELVEIACDRYEFGLGDGGETFAVPKSGPQVALMLRGGRTSLRGQLARDFYARTGRAAGQQALADALMVIEGMAQEEEESRLYLRCAQLDGVLWLDLGDQAGRAVRITAAGWSVEDSAPVLFRRTALNGPLPDPARGGEFQHLWKWLNVAEADRPLVVAWLVTVLFPDIPHPVLGIFGEQGTGKSTAARVLALLLDPGPVPVRKPPRDADSWVTAAAGSWLVALDNLSDIQPWLSDSLCRAVTGDGDVRRKLYTDGELAVFSYRRCVILNGIDIGAIQPDLADRMLPVDLDLITEQTRLTEEDLWPAWQHAHPAILGALLDLAVKVKAQLPSVHLERKPRMADFARIAAAVDLILGTNGLPRYVLRGADLAADGLSGFSFAVRIQDVIKIEFDGTSAKLLELLTPPGDARPAKDWPKDGRAVTTLLHRIGPALRKLGWTFAEKRDSHTKLIHWTISPPQQPEKARQDYRASPQLPQPSSDAVMSGNEYGPSQDVGPREVVPDAWPEGSIGQAAGLSAEAAVAAPEPDACTACGKPLDSFDAALGMITCLACRAAGAT
jgi:hypothetical protein